MKDNKKNQVEFYLNSGDGHQCERVPSSNPNLLKENYLSEFSTEEDKQQARDNLGVTEVLDEIRNLLNTLARIPIEGIGIDLEPTENSSNLVTSHGVYKTYYNKQEVTEKIENLRQQIIRYIYEEMLSGSALEDYYTKTEVDNKLPTPISDEALDDLIDTYFSNE